MERLLHRMGQGADGAKRILELNPSNPAVIALRDLQSRSPDDPRVEAYARLFFEEAVIAEGSKIADAAGFARRVNELIARAAKE
jgi:molecular chaperone HtpG